MHQPWTLAQSPQTYQYPDDRVCTLTYAYGYGLVWSRDDKGRIYIGHSGGLPGFGSNWYIMPDYGIRSYFICKPYLCISQ